MTTKIIFFFKDKRAVLLLLLIFLAGVLQFQSNTYHHWEDKDRLDRIIIRSDGAGYYAYLPQHIIYHDPNYFFVDSMLLAYPNGKMDNFRNYEYANRNQKNKYFPGVAICQAPFFMGAHWLHSAKYKSDGYSYPYQKAIALGGICFLLLGVFLTYLVMIRLKIAPLAAAFSLISIVLGTPLLFYTVNEPLASHVYSFAIIALFVYLLLLWRDTCHKNWLPLLSVTLGLIVLLRPTNGLVALLYFALFPDFKTAWHFLRENLLNSVSKISFSLLCFAAVIFIQFGNVYYQTGQFAFNIYPDESFDNWKNPPILAVLFSFRKGLFLYAPLCLIAFLGLFYTFKKYRFPSLVVLLFFFVFTYVTAAWWCWWYGGSVGMRPMIDISILFALGLAFLLHFGKIWVKILYLPIFVFCLLYQLTLSFQYENGILHFSEMNKERYLATFMKRDRRFQWMYYQSPLPNFEKIKQLKTALAMEKENVEIEHQLNTEFAQIPIDPVLLAKYKGIRLTGNIMIRDKNNLPMLEWISKNGGNVEILQTNFIAKDLPSLYKKGLFTADYVFPPTIILHDTLTLRYANTHGKTNLGNLKIYYVQK